MKTLSGSLQSRVLFLLACAIGIMILTTTPAYGGDQCTPVAGTIYFWYTDTWHGTVRFTIGGRVLHADVVANNTSFFDGGDTALGSENWTLDFGNGNSIHLITTFTIEHMTDAVSTSGVMHVIEIGTFRNGRGLFKGAYGNLSAHGPFGPGVKLPGTIKPAPDAIMLGILPAQGTVCFP